MRRRAAILPARRSDEERNRTTRRNASGGSSKGAPDATKHLETTQPCKGASRKTDSEDYLAEASTHLGQASPARVRSCDYRLHVTAPAVALAQSDKLEVDIAPLYFWVATTNGDVAINGTRDIPVYMDFADAKSKLAGAFSFHGEARKGRWGVLGDINFIRLSTDVSYTTPIINAPIAGTFEFDQNHLQRKGDLRSEARVKVPRCWWRPHLDDVAGRALYGSCRRTARRH